MAQGIKRKIEIVFFLLIGGIFVLIMGNYFKSFFQELSYSMPVITKDDVNLEDIYTKYKNEVEELHLKDDYELNQSEGFADSVSILVYHGIVEEPKTEEDVSIETFKEQMFLLKKSGYRTITMVDFYEFIKNGKQLPAKSFMVTFDDGRKDSYYPTDPILAALDYNAVMFVITNNFEKNSKYYLNDEELKNMIDTKRWEINSHGKNAHGYIQINENGDKGRYLSNKMWLEDGRLETENEYNERIIGDLVGSKNDIEGKFGVKVNSFALPAGDYGSKSSNFSQAKDYVLSALKSSYPLYFFQFRPEVDYGYYRTNYKDFLDDPYFFRRIKITKNIDASNLVNIIRASENKDLPYEEKFNNEEDWISGWGEKNMSNNNFTIKNNSDGKSAGVYLDGAYLWQDYKFDASIQVIDGEKYSLEAMTGDGKTFIGCSFFDGGIKSYESIDGNVKDLKKIKLNKFDVNSKNKVSIVAGVNSFYCGLNEEMLIESSYDYLFNNGGIAIKVFASKIDTTVHVEVDGVKVSKNNSD